MSTIKPEKPIPENGENPTQDQKNNDSSKQNGHGKVLTGPLKVKTQSTKEPAPQNVRPNITTSPPSKRQKLLLQQKKLSPVATPQKTEPKLEQPESSPAPQATQEPQKESNPELTPAKATPEGAPSDLLLQQSLARKRDLKGGYKAKLSLEKLIIEHERKMVQLKNMYRKQEAMQKELNELRTSAGKKIHQGEETKGNASKTHHEFLIKEMLWMQEDFDREHKKKTGDAKKQVRMCRKELQERQLKKVKQQKDAKIELKRKANAMSKMVSLYWRSVEKIVKHNYGVQCDKKRQHIRAKKLENFVSKHLKLSVKVAEELNTKQFVEQSMYKEEENLALEQQNSKEAPLVKLYESQDGFEDPKAVVKADQNKDEPDDGKTMENLAEQTVKMAEMFKPVGTTLESAQVATMVPFLLRGTLREYQIIGLDWLVTLHNKRLNGILADEMGLGKTIQTISMLASLACDKGVWGPHLIVVPTTIIINWEMEFKRWCPALKILTYFGSQKERKLKRQGWSKENSFHVCITSYKLVIQDHFAFRRKKWYYMVLDEAQNIKNFKSQRWQTLLRFNTRRRLLLTGTPLQNDVMELWSLMHFLMPQIFSNQQDFKEWFSNPFSKSINQNQSLNIGVVQKLQSILRPFLLRRMKRDVEKQLPEKVEHIVQCNLSRRQRLLYDEYINSDRTKNTLADSDFFSIMNVLMQLRKVCNHPDLFEQRTIESPFIMTDRVKFDCPQLIHKNMLFDREKKHPMDYLNLVNLNLHLISFENMTRMQVEASQELFPARTLVQTISEYQQYAPYNISDALTTMRPGLEGQAVGRKHFTNCNVLHETNTQNLALTVPKILPAGHTPLKDVYRPPSMHHQHPNYLNVACLPFAQQFYSLDDFNQMRFPSTASSASTRSTNYHSSLDTLEQKDHLVALGQKLVAFAHFDFMNRLKIQQQKPIYGADLRAAVKISLLFQGDLHDNKRHIYVGRSTKQNKQLCDETHRVPSAVWNSFALKQSDDIEYEPAGCRIVDFPDLTEDEIERRNLENSLVQEVTLTQQMAKTQRKQKELLRQQQEAEELRRRQEEEAQRAAEEAIRLEAELAEKRRIEEEEAKRMREVEVEERCEPTEETGFFIEINTKAIKEHEQQNTEEFANPNVSVFGKRTVKKLERIPTPELSPRPEAEQIEDHPMSEDIIISPDDSPPKNEIQEILAQQQAPQEPEQSVPEAPEVEHQIDQEQGEQKDEVSLSQEGKELRDQASEIEERLKDEEMAASQKDHESDHEMKSQQDKSEAPEEVVREVLSEPTQLNYQIGVKYCDALRDMVVTPLRRAAELDEKIKHYKCIIPKVVATTPTFVPTKIDTRHQKDSAYARFAYQKLMRHRSVNQSLKFSNILFFPHKNLIQYDCGKLQRLAQLLKTLYLKKSKVLIFTQMTRMLDVLENFLNLHGYTYVRLDGSVKVEARQKMVDKFNLNPKLFCFISSTRCGGIGINLTGADCVIFYDTDWNPAMDKQAQDRCHRIGQTKTVHIYRLISINTIEENIFKKSLQKRELGGLIIEGNFDMEFFQKVQMKDILEGCDQLMKVKKKNLMQEENIVFHHHNTTANEFGDKKAITSEDQEMFDFQKQRELEAYRRRFEEAMIRIEDEEDIEAYKEAKAEIDDEFDEDKQEQTDGATTKVTEEGQEPKPDPETEEPQQEAKQITAEDEAKAEKLAQQQKAQEALDRKNAAGVSRDLKKSELIDWRNHPTLNKVTKEAIRYYETQLSYEDYMIERNQKEQKAVGKPSKLAGQQKQKHPEDEDITEESEEEEEEEDVVADWNRQMAEQLYQETREDLEERYVPKEDI